MPFGIGFWANGAVTPAATGSYVLLETTVLTGSQASVEFTNLTSKYASTYQHLQIRAVLRSTQSVTSDTGTGWIRFNGDSATNYNDHGIVATGSVVVSGGSQPSTFIPVDQHSLANDPANSFGAAIIDILDAFETGKFKTVRSLNGFTSGQSASQPRVGLFGGAWRNTAAISSITYSSNRTSFAAGSRFSLYGLKAA